MKNKILLIVFAFNIAVLAQHVRVMTYNLENYPNGHDSYFKTIVNQVSPDILVVVEMLKQDGVNQFLNNSLSTDYSAAPVAIRNDGSLQYYNDCCLYYKSSTLTLLQTSEIPADTRVISEFKLLHNLTKDTLIVFGVHLKANTLSGDNSNNILRRSYAVESFRNRTRQLRAAADFIIVGDFNFLNASESGVQKLIDQSSPGYVYDAINAIGEWSDNPSFAFAHTYSPTNLKTRFDFIFISQAVKDKGGIDYIDNSFKILGNDGNHYAQNITAGSNYWFSSNASLGTALVNASDHLPVYADFNFNAQPNDVSTIQSLPSTFKLLQNYPNPFNPSTVISYQLASPGFVNLKVFDPLGREITTLVNEFQRAGIFNSPFSILNMPAGRRSSQLQSGVYFYQLKVGNFVQTKKMVLLK